MPNPRPPTGSPRAQAMPQPEEPSVPERDLLRALMEHLPDLIYFKDVDSRFTYLNRPTAAALGCPEPAAVVGKTDFDFYPEDLASRFFADERRILATGEPLRNQVEAQTGIEDGGAERWLLTSKAPVVDAAGRVVGLVGSAKDVTEERRAEELLRRREAQLQVLLQHGWDMVSVLDADGVRRYVSPACERILGYRPEELLGRHAAEIDHPDDAHLTHRFFAELAGRPGAVDRFEVRVRRRDGAIRWLEVVATNRLDDPHLRGFVVNSRDVTDRKEAAEAVRASEARFRALVRNALDIITILEADGTARYQSPAIERVLGYAPDELIGTDVFTLVHPDDLAMVRARFAEALARPGVNVPAEFRFRHKDRSWRWLEAVGTNLLTDPSVGGIVVNSRDATERRRAAEALRESEARLRAVWESASDAIALSNPGGLVIAANPAYLDLYGYPAEEVIGRCFAVVFPEAERKRALARYKAIFADPHPAPSYGARVRRADGTERFVEVRSDFVVRDGRRTAMVSTIRDVTERKRAEERLTYLAFHDGLTGLPNRVLFGDRLGQALRGTRRRREAVGVLCLDLDGFKVVNDSLGHAAGDRVLVAAGQRLVACLRAGDCLARLGGDEFAVLLAGLTGASQAAEVAERLVAAMRPPFSVDGHEANLGASVGVAVGSPELTEAADLLRAADVALYRAKATGRGTVAVFDPRTDEPALERLGREAELRRALERRELRLAYQPVVDLTTREVVGVEALVRWEHPRRGLLLPREFVPLAEETGLVLPMGRWVLNEACRRVRDWNARRPDAPPLRLSVNLSTRQFHQPDLADDLVRALREHCLPPGSLILEVTESSTIADAAAAAATLRELKELGVRVAIDDFGTGYAALSSLKCLPVDELKVDRSFLAGFGVNPEDTAIVRAVVGVAKALGLGVTAEGVETEAQLAALRELGCDRGQGNLFAPPLTGDQLGSFLAKGNGQAAGTVESPASGQTMGVGRKGRESNRARREGAGCPGEADDGATPRDTHRG